MRAVLLLGLRGYQYAIRPLLGATVKHFRDRARMKAPPPSVAPATPQSSE